MGVVYSSFKLLCNWRGDTPPEYRLYIDNELVAERSYIWDNSVFAVEERIPLNIEPGPHHLYVRNLSPELGEFIVEDFKINDKERVYRLADSRFVINPDDIRA